MQKNSIMLKNRNETAHKLDNKNLGPSKGVNIKDRNNINLYVGKQEKQKNVLSKLTN